MTAHRYSVAKTMETSTMRISAAIGPDAPLNDGSPRMITADAAPASAEASTYFQTASTIEATPRPAGLPAYRSANRENAEIRDPRRRDPERAPPEAEEKQNGDHRELEDPPAEQAVRPSDGKVDPDLDEIDEHQPGRGREEREDQTRLRPLWAQQQEQQILADQSQVHTQSHADEREGRERAEQMPAASRGVSREATEGRHGHTCDRSRDFDRNREEVECLLVESERLRAKSPPDQEVVHVPHEVADREASVRVDREPQRRDRAVVAPWQPGDPSTPYPGARRRGQW